MIEPAINKYPVMCAWCKCHIGETTVPNSHGICDECLVKVKAELMTRRRGEENDD